MVHKNDIKILTDILDLDDIKVISHRLHEGIGIILQTESKKLVQCSVNTHTIFKPYEQSNLLTF
jgi:hypothetical protein